MRGVRKRHGDQRKACGKTGKLDGKNGLVNRAEFVVTGSKIMNTSVERKKNVGEEGVNAEDLLTSFAGALEVNFEGAKKKTGKQTGCFYRPFLL